MGAAAGGPCGAPAPGVSSLAAAAASEALREQQPEQQQQQPQSPTSSSGSNGGTTVTSIGGSTADDVATTGSSRGPGKRYWTDGRCKHLPVPLRALAMLTLLIFISWIYFLGALLVLAPFSRIAATLAVGAWLTLLLPCQPVIWKPFLSNSVAALWRKYFSYAVVYDEKLNPEQHYLFADFPHGAFPLSQLLGLTVRHLACWEGERFYGMAADSAFRVPLWRHVYTWLGIVPASARNLRRYLKWGSVGITPGGIAEMYLAGGPADHIYIRSRKGFVAVAVEEGVDIVPVYHFGNTQILSFGPRFLEPYGRKWRFSLGLLYGIATLPIPRRVRLMMVVGSPVRVTRVARGDPGFQAAVDDTHARYMAALQGLYDKYKGLYGWQDHPLVMH